MKKEYGRQTNGERLCGSPKRSPRLGVRDRLRTRLDERRWRDYERSTLSIFYRVQA